MREKEMEFRVNMRICCKNGKVKEMGFTKYKSDKDNEDNLGQGWP